MTPRRLLGAGLVAAATLVGLRDAYFAPRPPHRAVWLLAGNTTVRALRGGDGDTTLVLLHGYGESLMAWRALFDPLATRYRVIAMDLPGFGLSDKPRDGYDLPSQTERVSDFVRRHAHGPVVLVGHSMGGELAASVALAHPTLVAGLVLIDPAGAGLASLPTSLPPAAQALAGAMTPAVLPVHDPAWLSEPPPELRYAPEADPDYRAAMSRTIRDFDFNGLDGRLAGLDKPVLLIWGGVDPTIPLATGRRMLAQLPHGCLQVVPNGLHRPHEAQPDLVLSYITQFLDDGGACAGTSPSLSTHLPE